MDYKKLITIEPGKRGGTPCVRGLRITVYDVLEYLASGMSEDEILRDFPDLTRDDIRACSRTPHQGHLPRWRLIAACFVVAVKSPSRSIEMDLSSSESAPTGPWAAPG